MTPEEEIEVLKIRLVYANKRADLYENAYNKIVDIARQIVARDAATAAYLREPTQTNKMVMQATFDTLHASCKS